VVENDLDVRSSPVKLEHAVELDHDGISRGRLTGGELSRPEARGKADRPQIE
jgi:hypothetical protein